MIPIGKSAIYRIKRRQRDERFRSFYIDQLSELRAEDPGAARSHKRRVMRTLLIGARG